MILETNKMVGLARLELATPSLSGTYSNHLSYNPTLIRIYRRQLSTHKYFFQNLYDEMMMKVSKLND